MDRNHFSLVKIKNVIKFKYDIIYIITVPNIN